MAKKTNTTPTPKAATPKATAETPATETPKVEFVRWSDEMTEGLVREWKAASTEGRGLESIAESLRKQFKDERLTADIVRRKGGQLRKLGVKLPELSRARGGSAVDVKGLNAILAE